QSQAYKLFSADKLQVVPSWLLGFNSAFLDYLGEVIARPDACPTLFGDDLAMAGLIKCAGGPLKDRFEFDFFKLLKQSPKDSGLLDSAALEQWKKVDAYHGVKAVDLLQKSYEQYYERSDLTPRVASE